MTVNDYLSVLPGLIVFSIAMTIVIVIARYIVWSGQQKREADFCVALTDCIDALEIGLNYVQESGWTRTRDKEAAIIQAAIDKAKEVMG